jgi:hypothetical protein
MKIAVTVNEMSKVNVDAELVKQDGGLFTHRREAGGDVERLFLQEVWRLAEDKRGVAFCARKRSGTCRAADANLRYRLVTRPNIRILEPIAPIDQTVRGDRITRD